MLTDLQYQKIWEWAGFKLKEDKVILNENLKEVHVCLWKNGEEIFAELPAPTLDNFFKWIWDKVVDKIQSNGNFRERNRAVQILFGKWFEKSITNKDYAEALHQATWEVINGT